MNRLTLTERITRAVQRRPGRTATELARFMRMQRRLASISGALNRLARTRKLVRVQRDGAWMYWPTT